LFDNVSTIGGTRAKNTKTFAWTNNVRKNTHQQKTRRNLMSIVEIF